MQLVLILSRNHQLVSYIYRTETMVLPELVNPVGFLLVASANDNLQTIVAKACLNIVNWISRLRLTCSVRRPVVFLAESEMSANLGKCHKIQEQ